MTANVTLSASAAKQINTILAGQTAGTLLRVGVEGGGWAARALGDRARCGGG